MRWVLVWAGVAVVPIASVRAQPTIDHSGLDCMRPGEYAVVLSGIDPGNDVQTAKVYFRSSLYRDFYYVEMTYQDGQYVGILPQPSPETPAVIYYLEALDSAFNTARSLEYDADIRGRCSQEPAAAYFPGGDPGIAVGATTLSSSPIPPGFAAAGIASTITAAGLASGVGGGLGAGTAVAVGAAVAAGAGAGVLAAGGGDETTSSIIATLPTSSSATTSTGVSGGTTSTPGPSPGPGPSSTSTTTISGQPTTTVPGGPTTTTTVPGGPTTTTVPGGPTTTTSAAPSTTTTPPTTTVPSLDASCFTVDVLGACRVRLDASCVALPVDRYEWVLDLNGRWKKVEFPDGPASLVYTWSSADCGEDDSIRFRLKVRRGGSTETAHKNVDVPGDDDLKSLPAGPVRFRIDTAIEAPAPTGGRILVNGAPVRVVDSAAPVTLNASGRRGSNTLTGVVETGSGAPGRWRFALDRIVPGTLEIVSGNVVTREPSAVVFRVAGHVGERLELRFVIRE